MADPIMTLAVSPAVYAGLEQRARRHHRRVEDEATLTLAAAIGADEFLPDDLAAALSALASLDDEALQRVSRSQPTVEDGVLLDALTDKSRRVALSATEEGLLAVLIERHDRVMVLRAEAVALLRERGVDVQGRVTTA